MPIDVLKLAARMRSVAEMSIEELISAKRYFLSLISKFETEIEGHHPPARLARICQLHKRAIQSLDRVGSEINRRSKQQRDGAAQAQYSQTPTQ